MAKLRRRDPEGDDERYLELRRSGLSLREIAKQCKVSYRTVWKGVAAAREREAKPTNADQRGSLPNILPRFGSSGKPLALLSCEDVHPGGPMPKGDRWVCPVCHAAPAVDGRLEFKGVKPLPKDRPAYNPTDKPKTPSRRDRRAALASLKDPDDVMRFAWDARQATAGT